jgi:hypothetical protein
MWRSLALVALTTSLLLPPAVATANPLDIPAAAPPQFRAALRAKLQMKERRSSSESRIDLGRQHGYRLMVFAEGNVVAFAALDERRRSQSSHSRFLDSLSQVVTAYVTHGTVTPSRIEGSFGRFGSVSVRFRPSGRTSAKRLRRCRGQRGYVTRYGTFAGNVRFTGEDKYVAVRAHRAKGQVRGPRHIHCHRGRHGRPLSRRRSGGSGSRSGESRATIFAERRIATAGTEVLAFQAGDGALLLALAEESLGRMAVVHYALEIASGSVLIHDDALTSATLAPPRPFHGKGIYEAAPDGTKTWGGSLSVAFPGSPRLPLTGPEFAAKLEVGF